MGFNKYTQLSTLQPLSFTIKGEDSLGIVIDINMRHHVMDQLKHASQDQEEVNHLDLNNFIVTSQFSQQKFHFLIQIKEGIC